jgi:small subunit ribosomal protein S5
LQRCTSPRAVAQRRGKKVADILGTRKDESAGDAPAAEAAHV